VASEDTTHLEAGIGPSDVGPALGYYAPICIDVGIMLTPALRDFHHTALNRHIDALDGMNPGEYASQYSTDDVDTAGLDERASLATFYRCFPYTG
jgi:hypothetical protein